MHRITYATFLLCTLLLGITVNAQDCNYNISGTVTDKQKSVLPGAIVHLQHAQAGDATDINGHFLIKNVCRTTDTLVCQTEGYAAIAIPVSIDSDLHINIQLSANTNELAEVVVNGQRMQDLHTVAQTELTGLALLQTRGESLGEALKNLPGLNTVQTGPTLSKPVIHGLHSNRVLLINNGVRQEGQQWGSEHAPEIDPFIADNITVVKGAASVRYGADAVAGVVLLNPAPLPATPGISGDVYLIGATNGHVGGTSLSLQGMFDKKLKGLSWRVQGTFKEAGNFHTPNYYLINTGLREGDFSANIAYKWKRFIFNLFYSQYNTEVGIFPGAESGNLDDLLLKFKLARPLEPSYFSYNINRSYQTVYHDLLKASAEYDFRNNGKLELIFGRQNDVRKEYDDDLPYSTTNDQANIPQLSFQLVTHTLDLVYTQASKNGFSGNVGITGNTSGNVYEGIRYLIPNFRDYNGAAFAIERYDYKKLTFEAGIRYDYRWLRVYKRDPTTLVLYNSTYTYSNVTGTVGATYHFNDKLELNFNTGTAWRAPSINEMYINGEHFSDASYEIGDSSLKSERALNTGLSLRYNAPKLRANVDVYYNSIQNYIYEMPLLNPVTLISGTYPAFAYVQDNVNIKGVDADIQYDLFPHLTLLSKTTIVRGYNETIHNYLIYMPADRFENGIEYHLEKLWKLSQPYISVEDVTVSTQTRVPPNSDYVPPPVGYSLINAMMGFTIPMGKHALDVNLTGNNLNNKAYRDYLDHFRYYNDELGTNFIVRLKYSF